VYNYQHSNQSSYIILLEKSLLEKASKIAFRNPPLRKRLAKQEAKRFALHRGLNPLIFFVQLFSKADF
jgi:hypothetical protein